MESRRQYLSSINEIENFYFINDCKSFYDIEKVATE